MEQITKKDLMEWDGDERVIDAEAVAGVLDEMLQRIRALEQRAGRCECMNCVVIGI